jgi:hypothetical protein
MHTVKKRKFSHNEGIYWDEELFIVLRNPLVIIVQYCNLYSACDYSNACKSKQWQ